MRSPRVCVSSIRSSLIALLLGFAVPPLAAYVKPYLGETVFVLLLFSYLRTDPNAFRSYLRAPGLAIAASLWLMLALPLLFGTIYSFTDLRAVPALYTIMILHIAIGPVTSSAAGVSMSAMLASIRCGL